MKIKTKESASALIALLSTVVVAVVLVQAEVRWLPAVLTVLITFALIFVAALFLIRKYVAYKLKPIYSIVLSRNVSTREILEELQDKRVEHLGDELTAWADTNDRDIVIGGVLRGNLKETKKKKEETVNG